MVKFLMVCLTLTLGLVFASDHKEAHGNPEDVKLCVEEVRALNCGSPEDQKAFISCVDYNVQQLSDRCQAFHKDEVERMKAHGI